MVVAEPESEPKRRAILAAASKLFFQHGFKRTTVEEVAQAAGVAKGTIYLYFADKTALFRALIAAYEAEVARAADEAIAKPGTTGDQLLALLDAKYGFSIRLLHEAPHAREMMEATTELAAERLREFGEAYRLQLEGFVRSKLLPIPGGTPSDLDAADLARLLQAACEGLMRSARSPSDFSHMLSQLVPLVIR